MPSDEAQATPPWSCDAVRIRPSTTVRHGDHFHALVDIKSVPTTAGPCQLLNHPVRLDRSGMWLMQQNLARRPTSVSIDPAAITCPMAPPLWRMAAFIALDAPAVAAPATHPATGPAT